MEHRQLHRDPVDRLRRGYYSGFRNQPLGCAAASHWRPVTWDEGLDKAGVAFKIASAAGNRIRVIAGPETGNRTR